MADVSFSSQRRHSILLSFFGLVQHDSSRLRSLYGLDNGKDPLSVAWRVDMR